MPAKPSRDDDGRERHYRRQKQRQRRERRLPSRVRRGLPRRLSRLCRLVLLIHERERHCVDVILNGRLQRDGVHTKRRDLEHVVQRTRQRQGTDFMLPVRRRLLRRLQRLQRLQVVPRRQVLERERVVVHRLRRRLVFQLERLCVHDVWGGLVRRYERRSRLCQVLARVCQEGVFYRLVHALRQRLSRIVRPGHWHDEIL